jgi:hypothetical protein
VVKKRASIIPRKMAPEVQRATNEPFVLQPEPKTGSSAMIPHRPVGRVLSSPHVPVIKRTAGSPAGCTKSCWRRGSKA